jgi:hypothetical protein
MTGTDPFGMTKEELGVWTSGNLTASTGLIIGFWD